MDKPYRAAVPSGEVDSVTAKPSAAGLGKLNRLSVMTPTNCKKGL